MPGNYSATTSKGNYVNDISQTDAKKSQPSDSATSSLIMKIDSANNTAGGEIAQNNYHSSDDNSIASTKTNWFKYFLIGVAALTGVGTIVAACSYRYASGRAEASHGLENVTESPLIAPLASDVRDLASRPDIAMSSSAKFDETSLSPYSYYESIYGDKQTRNKILTQKSVAVTVKSQTTEKSVTELPSDNTSERWVKNLQYKIEREIEHKADGRTELKFSLDEKNHNELAYFCSSFLQSLVYSAYKAEPAHRCELLGKLIDKIDEFKFNYSLLKNENANNETLSVDEEIKKNMAGRILTASYLAAEYIIDRKEQHDFYINAMTDDKNYSAEEMIKREKRIMNYLPQHYAMGECRHPGQAGSA